MQSLPALQLENIMLLSCCCKLFISWLSFDQTLIERKNPWESEEIMSVFYQVFSSLINFNIDKYQL